MTSSKQSDGKFAADKCAREAEAAARVQRRQAELTRMLAAGGDKGAPSFYEADEAARRAKQARIEAHRRDKNRFQVPSSANASRTSSRSGLLHDTKPANEST